MCGDALSIFDRAAIFEISGYTCCPEGVAADAIDANSARRSPTTVEVSMQSSN